MLRLVHLAGYLYSFGDQPFGRAHLADCSTLTHPPEDTGGWLAYQYRPDGLIPGIEDSGQLPYDVVFRWGRGRVLILAANHKIVRHFADREAARLLHGALRKVEFRVHLLALQLLDYRLSTATVAAEEPHSRKNTERTRLGEVSGASVESLVTSLIGPNGAAKHLQYLKTLAEDDGHLFLCLDRIARTGRSFTQDQAGVDDLVSALVTEQRIDKFRQTYGLSYLVGRTDAFGDCLTKIAFYGDSVHRADIVSQNKGLLKFYGCTLRHRDADVARLGRDGFVSFELPQLVPQQASRLREIDSILRYLTELRLVY